MPQFRLVLKRLPPKRDPIHALCLEPWLDRLHQFLPRSGNHSQYLHQYPSCLYACCAKPAKLFALHLSQSGRPRHFAIAKLFQLWRDWSYPLQLGWSDSLLFQAVASLEDSVDLAKLHQCNEWQGHQYLSFQHYLSESDPCLLLPLRWSHLVRPDHSQWCHRHLFSQRVVLQLNLPPWMNAHFQIPDALD